MTNADPRTSQPPSTEESRALKARLTGEAVEIDPGDSAHVALP